MLTYLQQYQEAEEEEEEEGSRVHIYPFTNMTQLRSSGQFSSLSQLSSFLPH
jgi:hypothetical protein